MIDPQRSGFDIPYGTIVVDPPWKYANTATRNAAEKQYPTMTLDELARLPEICPGLKGSPNSHLYLWTTVGMLRDTFGLLDAWGWEYKTNLVWAKRQMGLGNYFRVSHEHVLFGMRGDIRPPNAKDVRSWFEADRGKHSAKPDAFYEMVTHVSPGPYLDVFARGHRTGSMTTDGREVHWDIWGNERTYGERHREIVNKRRPAD